MHISHKSNLYLTKQTPPPKFRRYHSLIARYQPSEECGCKSREDERTHSHSKLKNCVKYELLDEKSQQLI
jgi:hypothetical protein